jgi:hypothetical protein
MRVLVSISPWTATGLQEEEGGVGRDFARDALSITADHRLRQPYPQFLDARKWNRHTYKTSTTPPYITISASLPRGCRGTFSLGLMSFHWTPHIHQPMRTFTKPPCERKGSLLTYPG